MKIQLGITQSNLLLRWSVRDRDRLAINLIAIGIVMGCFQTTRVAAVSNSEGNDTDRRND